jgi:hypothetical protein
MKGISGYILKTISLLLLIWGNTFFIIAGEKEDHKKLFYGFSVDFDLAEPFLSMLSSNKFGLNASIQADLFHTVYPILEVGYATYEGASDYAYIPDLIVQPDNYSYRVNGTYYKIGVDFNLLEKDFTKKIIPIGYLGIRYGISPFSYKIENLAVEDFYWEQTYLFNAKGSTVGQWAEFVAGVKTPVYKNICVGVSVRFRQFLYIQEKQEGDKIIRQSYAPGFGDKDDGKWGFRYTVGYFFPFTK